MMVSTDNTTDTADETQSAAGWWSPRRREICRSSSPEAELLALQQAHAKLQQAIFEAAQIQRRLCAPREHSWGEYQIAGEIFPVRHLSGDFFKVMEFPGSLGLVLGDIAGKGLSAGIWQAHVMGLIQRAARRHADPCEAVAEVNHELCHDRKPAADDGAVPRRGIDPETQELALLQCGLALAAAAERQKGPGSTGRRWSHARGGEESQLPNPEACCSTRAIC